MSFKKVCKVCGREFFSAKYSSRYCSENCYVKARNWASQTRHALDIQGDKRTLNEVLYNKVCPNCGRSFVARKTNTIYCSIKCGKEYRNSKKEGQKTQERHQKKLTDHVNASLAARRFRIIKACANCGRDFEAQKVTTMFCCSSCAKSYRLSRKDVEANQKITADTILQRVAIRESNAPQDAEFIRPIEAAKYLDVSKRTLYRYIASGIIRCKQLPGLTLVERASLKSLLMSDASLRVKTKRKIEVPEKSSNPVFSGDRITIPEAAEAYGITLNVMQHYLRRSDLEYIKYRNTRFYLRKDVDKLVRRRLRERHPDITSWYSVDDILKKFPVTKTALNWQLYQSSVPKKKEGGLTYYSQKHIDDLFGHLIQADKYYTTDEISQILGISKRQAAKLVQRFSLPKISRSGRIYVDKKAFEELLARGKLT